MFLELDSLESALNSLRGVVELTTDTDRMSTFDVVTRNGLRSGVIQNFEFTYELAWKFIKRWLEHNLGASYVDGVSRRELFRLAAENRLIDDVDRWMDYHQDRNLTSHTYNEDIAQQVYESAVQFVTDTEQLLRVLASRND
ncbi:MAG: nucleotidyltransferase substrate binding protein [Armatimonadota bacterium]